MMKKKAMFSQPMKGLTDEEIIKTREKAVAFLDSNEAMKERGVVNIPMCFMAKSIEDMSLCHVAYFAKGFEKARGCRIEHEVAKAYGMEILYEEFEDVE